MSARLTKAQVGMLMRLGEYAREYMPNLTALQRSNWLRTAHALDARGFGKVDRVGNEVQITISLAGVAWLRERGAS